MDEIEMSRYEHEPYWRRENPEYSLYNREFNKIDYWSEDYTESYYRYFLKINCRNEKEYDRYLKMVCKNYLESLVFTIEYYLYAKPAWRWYYRFRCAPLFSTLAIYLKHMPKSLEIIRNNCTTLNSNNFEQYILLGDIYLALKDCTNAKENYQNAGDIEPDNPKYGKRMQQFFTECNN